MTEHSTSLPRTATPVLRPAENPVPRNLTSTPSTPIDAPVSNPSPTFTPTGPALADALPISARAIAPAPTRLASAPNEAFGPLASASNTPASARARPIPASAMYPALGILCPGLFLRPDAYDPCLA